MFLIFFLSLAIVLFRPVFFYDLVCQAEGEAVRTFRKITGSGKESHCGRYGRQRK
ncbi:MAG: hypothetical protein K2P59_16540 [Acetatifactor sp.]|nr:hypothetical protein [Acetatifactor sp.]